MLTHSAEVTESLCKLIAELLEAKLVTLPRVSNCSVPHINILGAEIMSPQEHLITTFSLHWYEEAQFLYKGVISRGVAEYIVSSF